MEQTGTVRLETERLILRHFEMSDANAMFENWANDPDVVRYMPYTLCDTLEATRKQIDEWLQYFHGLTSNTWELFAIELKSIGEVIGTIDFAETDHEARSAEVGYQLGKAWWGKGYATEALQTILKYCFETIGLNRVWVDYDTRNSNSGRVMEKAGMMYEGISRQCKIRHGELVSRVHYALLAEDYFIKTQSSKIAQVHYRKADACDVDVVTDLLCALYHAEYEELLEDNKSDLSNNRQGFFLAFDTDKPIGIAQVSLRSEYVNGTESGGTCGYLEAVYVKRDYRMNGVAAALVRMCEDWAKERGCIEFASDCLLHNTVSYRFHLRIGFTETERCIFFRKEI